MSIVISSSELEKAGKIDADAFLNVFIEAYLKIRKDGVFDASVMSNLNGWQNSLLAYHLFREEVMQGGFVQLIQNGYGGFIFKNPFAKALRLFGADELSKLVYKAKEIYDKHTAELEAETNDEEFHAMYEKFEAFDELEERFFEIEEECTLTIAEYVDSHLDDFGEIK